MRRVLSGVLAFVLSWATAFAQRPAAVPFPAGVFSAKTVAIVNDTREPGVSKGAADALTSWGQFKVVDDPQLADITLRFEKKRQREGSSAQSPSDNGKDTSYSYSVSVSSTISMTAYYKDQDATFFSAHTDDSKNKAGSSCIDQLHTAYRAEAAQKQDSTP